MESVPVVRERQRVEFSNSRGTRWIVAQVLRVTFTEIVVKEVKARRVRTFPRHGSVPHILRPVV